MNNTNKEVERLNHSAKNSMLVNDIDEAIKNLQAAEVLDPDNPETLLNLGLVYIQKELFSTATDYLKKLSQLKLKFIDEAKVLKLLAFSYIKLERIDLAIGVLNEVLKIHQEDIEALNMKAFCENRKGDAKNALKTYKKVLSIDSSNKTSINSTAYIMAQNNINLNESLNVMKMIYDENNAAYNDTLGLIYLKLNDYENADKFLKKAKQLKPFSKEINNNIQLLSDIKKN